MLMLVVASSLRTGKGRVKRRKRDEPASIEVGRQVNIQRMKRGIAAE